MPQSDRRAPLKATDIVMEVVQVERRCYALFTRRAGYYELLDENLRVKAATALAEGCEITFTHDERLRVLSID